MYWLWSEPNKIDLHPIWAYEEEEVWPYPRNERKQQWNGLGGGVCCLWSRMGSGGVWHVLLCDQEWWSEDVWRVMIGYNCQLMCLLQNPETLGPVVVHGDMNIGQHTLATYNIYVKRDTNVYLILDILFSVTQWSWTDVYDEWTLQSATSWINM